MKFKIVLIVILVIAFDAAFLMLDAASSFGGAPLAGWVRSAVLIGTGSLAGFAISRASRS